MKFNFLINIYNIYGIFYIKIRYTCKQSLIKIHLIIFFFIIYFLFKCKQIYNYVQLIQGFYSKVVPLYTLNGYNLLGVHNRKLIFHSNFILQISKLQYLDNISKILLHKKNFNFHLKNLNLLNSF